MNLRRTYVSYPVYAFIKLSMGVGTTVNNLIAWLQLRICYYGFLSDESLLTSFVQNEFRLCLNLINNYLHVYSIHTVPGF